MRNSVDDGGYSHAASTSLGTPLVGFDLDNILDEVMPAAETSTEQNNREPEGLKTGSDGFIFWPSYEEIAPKVDLDHEERGRDIRTFVMPNARLTDGVFWNILYDIRTAAAHYGLPTLQASREARSGYVFAVSPNPNPSISLKTLTSYSISASSSPFSLGRY